MDEGQPTGATRQTAPAAPRGGNGRVYAQRVVWFVAGFIIVMLALRVVLLMLGANQGNAFVDLVYGVAGLFAAPFQGIFGSPVYGRFYFDTSSVVGMVIYSLLAWGISAAISLFGRRD